MPEAKTPPPPVPSPTAATTQSPTSSSRSSTSATSQAANQLKSVSTKRIMREIEHFKTEPPSYLANFTIDPKDMQKWTIQIKPRYYPYKYGVFKIKIDLHQEYPFKPPRMQFLTPIYHPNFDNHGHFCLSILQMDNWKAGTTVATVLDSLLNLIEKPEVERSLRVEIGEQYCYQRSAFLKTAAADNHGHFCLSILQMDNWKAGTTVATVLDSLLNLIEKPEVERSLRVEIGEQYCYQRSAFLKTAAADNHGHFCLSILQMDNWKAGTTVATVLDSLLNLIEKPEVERSLRVEIGEQYCYQRSAFLKTAAADNHGHFCLSILQMDNWKAGTTVATDMPSLIPDILFNVGKEVVEGGNQEDIYKFAVSGKEQLKTTEKVFASVTILNLYEDYYIVGFLF